ncbi:MAG: dUTP diphosphatase [Spirochaetaceae bacterium]|jgi:dUTP pyrophosphatase|nr:dUTP diphosphatase [Spirochaetaceae bacterium]
MKELVIRFTGKTDLAPHYASTEAAGADLKADLEEKLEIKTGERLLVPTGIFMEIPLGFEGQVRPRSGLAWKHGIGLLNSPGTIDSDYRGEIKVILINHGQESYFIKPGERIAQLVICPVFQAKFQQVENLENSHRGAGGFGSTGKH